MSRHEFTTASGRKVVLGWDNPLQTYFLQTRVARRPASRVWVGTALREIPDIAALEAQLAAHEIATDALLRDGAAVDWPSIRAQLEAERAAGRPPSSLQQAMAAGAWRQP